MEQFDGIGVCGAISLGRLYFYRQDNQQIKRTKIDKPVDELARFKKALDDAKRELTELYDKALLEVGDAHADIFNIHRMMLEDDDYIESVENIINVQGVNAEYAVAVTSDNFAQMFSEMEDGYMQARAADIRDVSDRVIRVLSGENSNSPDIKGSVIIVAHDLTPSETVQLDKDRILGFVTEKGSANSHTAILARSMNIPAIVNVGEIDEKYDGEYAIIDGYNGRLYVSPTEEIIEEYSRKREKEKAYNKLLDTLKGKENITRDGRKINVYANIGSPSDVGSVLQNDGSGVGLFRSEFLYIGQKAAPSEDEQFAAYRDVAEKMGGKPVIIRTMDIGADKKADYLKLPHEENPAMGFRAIRICLTNKELFRTQLRALYRASAFGDISIMFPMITSVAEIKRIKEFTVEVKNELKNEGIPYNENVPLGIMIETPAAAVISDLLAEEVDFFSIGTNDLTQYTLAMDRENTSVDGFFDPHHEAVLRLVENTVKNGHEKGIWVGICGELGADLTLTEKFIDMGVDELSVSPSMILRLREKIRNI